MFRFVILVVSICEDRNSKYYKTRVFSLTISGERRKQRTGRTDHCVLCRMRRQLALRLNLAALRPGNSMASCSRTSTAITFAVSKFSAANLCAFLFRNPWRFERQSFVDIWLADLRSRRFSICDITSSNTCTMRLIRWVVFHAGSVALRSLPILVT